LNSSISNEKYNLLKKGKISYQKKQKKRVIKNIINHQWIRLMIKELLLKDHLIKY